jgi:pSer/pThr/pTyr-binding forkhead associated (FHA) protein
MSARLVGWMPEMGRLNAAVGATARIGATPDNDVVVRVDGVSRTHATLTEQPDGYYIEDKSSKNGTWLNGERITRARLRHLDVITLGRFAEMIFIARDTDVPLPQAAPVQQGLRVRLEWLDGPAQGTIIDVPAGEIIIGRAESCGIVIESDSVSRAHVRLSVSDAGVRIEDLGTVNGTSVDGEPLTQAASLDSGAEVDVGQARRFRILIDGTPIRETQTPGGSTPIGAQDMEWATRLVWSAKDLEALRRETGGAIKSGVRGAAKPEAVAPRAAAARPAATPPPQPAAAAPASPAKPQAPAGPAAAKETVIARADHTMLMSPSLGTPPPAIRPDAGEGETRFDAAASVRLPQQLRDEAATTLGEGAPEDLPTSLGEAPVGEQRTALTPRQPLNPPSVLDRVGASSDSPTVLPGVLADGGRTQLGGSPFDLPSNAQSMKPEDLPTTLGETPADAVTHMAPNVVNPRDRTNLPPETVLGFRDVGPAARSPISSGATQLAPRPASDVPPAIAPPPAAPTELMGTIESVKLTGDLGTYVIPRGSASVGRSSEATIRIDSKEMSRIHAILSVTEHDVIVEDRGSINGTSVNGTAISGRRSLVHGDRVCFADFEFRLEVKRTEGHP